MKKKILMALGATLMISSVSFASPLDDYSKGNLAIDLNTTLSPEIESIDGEDAFGFGLTYGLGNNYALQYKYDTIDEEYGDGNVKANELNLLYQFTPNISAFAGWTKNKVSEYRYSDSTTGYQLGLIGQTQLNEQLVGWASIGAGNKVFKYEIGVGYEINPDLDLNLSYQHSDLEDFGHGSDKYDLTTKGLKVGITYKY